MEPFRFFRYLDKFTLTTIIISILLIITTPFIVSNLQTITTKAQTLTPTISSITSGNWSDPTIWNTGNIPKASDVVQISPNTNITYDVLSDEVISGILIHGTLKFSRTTNTRFKTSDSIVVQTGGVLDMGTPQDFISRDIKAEVIWQLTQAQANAFVPVVGMGVEPNSPGLYALSGSRWDAHGEPLLRTWSKLAQDAPAGATAVVVENDVTDWYVGGTVALTATNLPAQYYWSDRLGSEQSRGLEPQHEVRVIISLASLPGGRTRITLDKPLDFLHEGTAPFKGEVGLLTRNVVIRTELLGVAESTLINDVRTRKFSHTMYMAGARGDLQYVEFKFMGHYGKLGVYATHHHRMLETSKGMIVRGTSGWYNGFRCVNLHVSHGVLVEDNVCFNAQSASFFVERDPAIGINTDNAFVRNLAIANAPKPFVDRSGSIPGEFGARFGVDFWPGEGTVSEAFLGNVAAGNANEGGSGFHFPERGNGAWKTGFMDFTMVSNEVRSKRSHGIHSWQNSVPTRDIVDMRLLRNGDSGILWGAYSNPMKFYNAQFLENAVKGLDIISTNSFLQDSVVTGTTVDSSLNDFGFFISAYIAPQSPGHPVWIVRNRFKNLRTTAIFQQGNVCSLNEEIRDRPELEGNCSGFYTMQMGNTFESVGQNINFGRQPNPNSFARVFDYPGGINGHKDFVLVRKDMSDPNEQGVITKQLVNAQTFSSAEVDALVTPMSSLPAKIEFTGLLNWRPRDQQFRSPPADFTFFNTPDYPPEIILAVSMNGTVATMTAAATDDKGLQRVEFFVDWIPVGTLTAPNAGADKYQLTVDLANLPDGSGVAPRKYAYLYARAFDGTVQIARGSFAYEQRDYSNVIEIGPEVLLAGLPFLPPGQDTGQQPGTAPATANPPFVSRVSPLAASVSVQQGASQTFTVDATSGDNPLERIVWLVDDAPQTTVSLTDPSARESFQFVFPLEGEFRVTAEAIDEEGLSVTVTWVVTVVPPSTLTTGLIGHWKFDEGSGATASDSSGNGNTGALVNGPSWTTGKLQGALDFNTVNAQVDIPSTAALNLTGGQFTIAAWVNPRTLQTANSTRIVDKGGGTQAGGWTLEIYPNRALGLRTNDSAGIGTPANVITLNTWQHVAVTFSNGAVRLYVDGIDRGTGSQTTPTGTTLPVKIGARSPVSSNTFFNGLIDDVRIYSRALSATEAAVLATGSAIGSPPTPTPTITTPTPTMTPTPLSTGSLDKTGTLWAPYVEWELTNPTFSGNPFDLVATVTFTHSATGQQHKTQMFHDGSDTWKFRFSGTRTGQWTFTTSSSDPDLNGKSGTVTITPNPDPNSYGFVTNVGNKWARQKGNDGAVEAFVPQFAMAFGERPADWTDATVDQTVNRFMLDHGFNGLFVFMAAGWVDANLSGGRFDSTSKRDPDPNSFQALERIITKVHAAGGVVHIWYVGDCSRTQCAQAGFGSNGAQSAGEQRLLRYIAARLAPLPGWIMGYGYDNNEHITTSGLRSWGNYLRSHMGWRHFLAARDQGQNINYTFWPEADWYSRGNWFTGVSYADAVSVIDSNTKVPHSFDERWWTGRLNEEGQRRLRWQLMMAGGASGIWSAASAGSPYSNPEWFKTVGLFWQNRFLLDMVRDNSLSADSNTLVLRSGIDKLVFYRESASSIQMDLSSITALLPAVAVDTKKAYAEISLGTLTASSQTVTLPYSSDWAIAVGTFQGISFFPPTSSPTPTRTPAPTPQPSPTISAGTATPIPTATPTPTFTISGIVFVDTNENGAIDQGEQVFTGGTVTVTPTTGFPVNTTTDVNGNYSLTNLKSGTYTITFTLPQGFKMTTTNNRGVTLPPSTTVNFAIAPIPTLTPIPTATAIPSPTPTPSLTISSLDKSHVFLDRPEKLTLSGANLNTADLFTLRLKKGTATFLTVPNLSPLNTTTLEVDLSNQTISSLLPGPGFYNLELQRTGGPTITQTNQLLLTKLGDLWSDTATSTTIEPRDGKIDIFDVSRLLAKWNSIDPDDLKEADINGPNGVPDGKIDIWDANKMMANWSQ